MRPLTASELIRGWEVGQSQHALDRALTLLSLACPGYSQAELASLSIGQRDAYLLTLREITFGEEMNGWADCPQCSERLEFNMKTSQMRLVEVLEPQVAEYSLKMGEWELGFRLPNSWDLAAIVGETDVERAAARLRQRCLSWALFEGVEVGYNHLPEEAIAAMVESIAAADPQAEILLDLSCPACGHKWQVMLDIVWFLWKEISARAQRILQEVHMLARFYGWREADILSMSTVRRQCYLNLVG
ncbi:MAG: phage baseplate protein [Hormoscilla sp. SP12CHS1]|nr:phage baseplate protein [Hormoscilla sp. SP12CHS1]